MLVDEKPALNDDLLIHYGIPGMRWGHRKPQELVGDIRRSASNMLPFGSRRPAAPQPATVRRPASNTQRTGMSTGKKVAIGVGIAAGLAAGAYFLSKTGTRPSAQAMTGASNRAGLKMVGKILKVSGKTTVKSLKVAPKVAKVGGKATYKTTRLVAKGAYKGTTKLGKNTGAAIVRKYEAIQAARAAPKTVKRGASVFSKMLTGDYGPTIPIPTAGGVLNSVRRKPGQ